MKFEAGTVLPSVKVKAFNFAWDSDNKIHDNEVAKTFGFRGGLVPGVADYDYMVRPVATALGAEWLERGWAEARFLSPIYDGDLVEACARVDRVDSETGDLTLALELLDPDQTPCASGLAGLRGRGQEQELSFAVADYPIAPLPPEDLRPEACVAALKPGSVLGSLSIEPRSETTMSSLAERYNDPRLAELQADGALAPLPSSFYLDRANLILSSNVLLGPWIHVGSKLQHHRIPGSGELLSLRGRVHDSYARKGHEFAILDLLLVGSEEVGSQERAVVSIRHTAIVKPRS